MRTYICGPLVSLTIVALLSIGLGPLLTHVVLHCGGTAADDESIERFLAVGIAALTCMVLVSRLSRPVLPPSPASPRR